MMLALGEQQKKLRISGNTRLADGEMVPMTVWFTQDWLPPDMGRYLPKGLPLALTGPFNAPQYNFQAAVQEGLKQNYFSGKPEDIGNLIDLFTKKKDKKDQKKPAKPGNRPPGGGGGAAAPPPAGEGPASKPTRKTEANPLGDLLGDLFDQAAKDRERKEQEKKDRERRERERR